MRNRIAITIKKRSQPGWLMWLLIMLPFLFGTLKDFLGLPWGIRYILDIAWLWLLVAMVSRSNAKGKADNMLSFWVLLFLIYSAVSYLVLYQSAWYYLWGMRNIFRFFVAFFAFKLYLKPKDIQGYFTLFDILFWINIAMSLYQYFFMDTTGDYLGGIFGTAQGANGYTNIFFVIMVAKNILFYLEKKERLSKCILELAAMLMVAALAELKFFFAECILLLVLAVLFTDFTWRKLLVIFGGLILVSTGAVILALVFPSSEGFLSLDFFLEIGASDKGYTSSGDLNRLNAIPRINELWLKTGWQRMFGLGLGNCDTATYTFLNTPFFEAYGDMHYTWLSYAFMYLECGWIGLIFYFGFFVLVYLSIRRIEKRSAGIAKTYCRMGRILALMCMLIAIYNSSLRTEAGYMMYFALSIPFVMQKQKVAV